MPRALIVGGSMAGLIAASLLRQAGWAVSLFERNRGTLASRGAGLGLSLELLRVMRRAGARFDPAIGVAHRSWIWLDAEGKVVFEHPRPSMGGAWAQVYEALRQAVPPALYHAGATVTRIEQDGAIVRAHLAEGGSAEGELLIAADGVQSTVRNQLLPAAQPRYAGYVAWRGIVAESDLPQATLDLVDRRIAICFPEGEMLLTMPVSGHAETLPEQRKFYFIWYRPADEAALAALCTDATGHCHGRTIPPPLIRPDFVAAMRAQAASAFAPPIAAVVERAPQPLLQAITDLDGERLVFGRVVLIGDAAFVARPHVAAGVTKAALDAECLADALSEAGGDIAAGLAAYERRQRDFGRKLVAHSRHLGAYLEAQTNREAPAADHWRDPAGIIRAYGAPHLIHDLTPAHLQAAG